MILDEAADASRPARARRGRAAAGLRGCDGRDLLVPAASRLRRAHPRAGPCAGHRAGPGAGRPRARAPSARPVARPAVRRSPLLLRAGAAGPGRATGLGLGGGRRRRRRPGHQPAATAGDAVAAGRHRRRTHPHGDHERPSRRDRPHPRLGQRPVHDRRGRPRQAMERESTRADRGDRAARVAGAARALPHHPRRDHDAARPARHHHRAHAEQRPVGRQAARARAGRRGTSESGGGLPEFRARGAAVLHRPPPSSVRFATRRSPWPRARRS
jgi:hypothetical protein